MAETKIYIDDEVDRKLRELAMKRFGYGRGSISTAVEEALVQWLRRNSRIGHAIDEIVARAKKDKSIIAVVVFGSYAEKKSTYNDVDIGIILVEGADHDKKLRDYSALVENDDRFFDISILNDLPLDIRADALNNGVFVYTKGHGEEYDYAASVVREWSDFKPRLQMVMGK